MKCVVFLPGIMGSELRNSATNARVWPPSLVDIIAKRVKVDDLLSPNLVATKLMATVAGFYGVYRSIIRDIEACGYSTDGNQKRFIPFAYDWRKSNQTSAQALSDHLNQQDSFDEIVFIGHSMGGLVLRYLLESGEYTDEPWFNKVTQLITLGTPHNGAAAALNQVAGLASNLGMTANNVKILASDVRYPSAYQLVAPDGRAMTLAAVQRNELPKVINPFHDEIVNRYDLSADNIDASKAFWAKLGVNKRPQNIEYYSFVGSAHTTLYRLDWNGQDLIEQETKESGDGTVPVSSSLNTSIPHSFSQKKHATIFADRQLRTQLYRMLGASPDVTPHSASGSVQFSAPEAIGISTDKQEYLPQDNIEVVVSFTQPRSNPTCRFQIVQLDQESEQGDDLEEIGEPISVRFRGVELDNFKFTMAIDMQPGIYELRVAGEVDDPEPTLFFVAAAQ